MSGATERLYRIERLIRARGSVSRAVLLQELEVSPATLKRDLEFLRSRLGAPIEYDRFSNGYRFAEGTGAESGRRHELPGLWFDERELYSLLMAHQLLSGLDGDGTLGRHLQPLLDRIRQMLGADDDEALLQRVRIVAAARRRVPEGLFERVAQALLERQRLRLRYLSRRRGEVGERDVSPQRLVHYRNTWYLDAWCHRVDALRRFALDAVESAAALPTQRAKSVPMRQVQAAMDTGYGIFAGGERRWAELVFRAEAARWVAGEEWHPEQQGRWLPDGRYALRLPYVDATELLMDLLRQGPDVEVLEPPALRRALQERLQQALAVYGGGTPPGGTAG